MQKKHDDIQSLSALFGKFAVTSKSDYVMSLPNNPYLNEFAKVTVKTIKGLLTRAKCSGQDL